MFSALVKTQFFVFWVLSHWVNPRKSASIGAAILAKLFGG
jgi:hypothetical protein